MARKPKSVEANSPDDSAQQAMATELVQIPMPTLSEKERLNQTAFLTAFAELGRIEASAKACGLERHGHQRWLKEDLSYRERWEVALAQHRENVDARILKRIDDPEGNRGSDVLLMFYAKAVNPDKYREVAINVDGKAVDSMAEVKKLVSEARRKKQAEVRDKPAVSVQEQAEAVVRAKVEVGEKGSVGG